MSAHQSTPPHQCFHIELLPKQFEESQEKTKELNQQKLVFLPSFPLFFLIRFTAPVAARSRPASFQCPRRPGPLGGNIMRCAPAPHDGSMGFASPESLEPKGINQNQNRLLLQKHGGTSKRTLLLSPQPEKKHFLSGKCRANPSSLFRCNKARWREHLESCGWWTHVRFILDFGFELDQLVLPNVCLMFI